MIKQDLSVRELEKLVQEAVKAPSKKEAKPASQQELPQEYYRVLSHIGKFFSDDISLRRTASGKGTMTIHFGSDDEVRRFLQALDDAKI